MTWYLPTQSHYSDWANQSLPYPNGAECLATKWLVQICKSLVWFSQGSNPWVWIPPSPRRMRNSFRHSGWASHAGCLHMYILDIYVCVDINIHIYIHVHTCINVHAYAHVCTYTHVYVYLHVYIHICYTVYMCICMYICTSMYVHICIVHIYIYIFPYLYI